jgi:thiamine transporter ThiT
MKTMTIPSGPGSFPYVLKFTDIHLYLFAALFVALDVTVPWLCHWIHPLAGPTFLPMFFFILMAGLLFGWRMGFMVGVMTPIVSYGISGMPVAALLPRIMAEAVCYGLFAGFFRENFNMGVVWSLIGTLILGRIAAGLATFIIHQGAINPVDVMWKALQIGWPGVLIQLAFLPLAIKLLEKLIPSIGLLDEK